MTHYQGILLLGPTGSGKSPLGDRIEESGLGQRRFCHFDFGASLRRVVADEKCRSGFSEEDLAFLRSVLQSGALLENDRFPLAERVLAGFLEQRCHGGQTEVVLNGLPRHVGQAGAVARIVDIHTVVSLECSEDVVVARIEGNVGGDRLQRSDDSRHDIRRKLTIFAQRTGPLVDHYREKGIRIITLPVTPQMTAESAWRVLQDEFPR